MTRLEEIDERRRRKTRMRLPQLNKANRLAKRNASTLRPYQIEALKTFNVQSTAEPVLA